MQERTQSYLQFLVAAASLVIIIAGMRAIASVLNPILMALLILFVSLPMIRWLEAKGLGRRLAVGLTCLVVLAAIAGVVLLVGSSLVQLLAGLPTYQATFDEKVAGWQSTTAA